jgi:serine/threonine protein kinase
MYALSIDNSHLQGSLVYKIYTYFCNFVVIHHRAPELTLGNKFYDSKIDMWSIGCIFGELFIHTAVFKGTTDSDQWVEIIKKCGKPSLEEWPEMEKFPYYGPLVRVLFIYTILLYAINKQVVSIF